jgi:hypothetical protein
LNRARKICGHLYGQVGAVLEGENRVPRLKRPLPLLKQLQLLRVTFHVPRQNPNVVAPHVDEAGLLKLESFLVFSLGIRHSKVWNDAAVSVADYDNQDVACPNFFQTRLDWLRFSRTKEFHRVVLELEAADGVKHRIARLN